MSTRLKWIDIVKGFALLCVIIGHSCERLMTGLSAEPYLIKYLDYFTNSFHVTLLFMASGFVYGLSRMRENVEGLKPFLRKKIIDLLLPYTWFAILIWIGKFIFSAFVVRTVSILDLLNMFINPVAYMWFIYVLFFISVFVRILEDALNRKETIIVIILAVMTFSWVIGKSGNILLDRFLFYGLFYYSGTLFAYHDKWKDNNIVLLLSGCLFLFFFVPYCNYRDILPIFKIIENGAGAVFFFTAIYKMAKRIHKERFFAYIGENTMFFYVIHPVALNAVRMFLMKADIHSQVVWFVLLVCSGVLVPYFCILLSKRYKILDFPFRPRRYIDNR